MWSAKHFSVWADKKRGYSLSLQLFGLMRYVVVKILQNTENRKIKNEKLTQLVKSAKVHQTNSELKQNVPVSHVALVQKFKHVLNSVYHNAFDNDRLSNANRNPTYVLHKFS
jgi:hypothetical protein